MLFFFYCYLFFHFTNPLRSLQVPPFEKRCYEAQVRGFVWDTIKSHRKWEGLSAAVWLHRLISEQKDQWYSIVFITNSDDDVPFVESREEVLVDAFFGDGSKVSRKQRHSDGQKIGLRAEAVPKPSAGDEAHQVYLHRHEESTQEPQAFNQTVWHHQKVVEFTHYLKNEATSPFLE